MLHIGFALRKSDDCYLSVSAATPGRILPSRNSRQAPPPVEMWVILSATPELLDCSD